MTLTDKDRQSQKITLDLQDLDFSPTLKRGFGFNQQKSLDSSILLEPLKWSYDDLTYEAFDYVLRPLCKDLKEFKETRVSMTPHQILQSPDLLEDTKKVLEWIYQKAKQEEQKTNNTLEDFVNCVFQAYYGADFLQLPFGVKRGIVNYLYDMGVTDQILDEQNRPVLDPLNSSEWG